MNRRSPSARLVAATVALAAASFAAPTAAIVTSPAPLRQLLAEADLVVHGHVVRATPERDPRHPRHIRTRVEVVVWETLAAPPDTLDPGGRFIELLMPGGSLDGRTTLVPGVPQLRPGDEAVLLLERVETRDGADFWAPLGYALGVLRVPPGMSPVHVIEPVRDALR